MNQPNSVIYATQAWPTNAHMLADVEKLGYISGEVLDCTFGLGNWWILTDRGVDVATDINSPLCDIIADFRHLPFSDNTFDTVAFDPPYKLNGTDQGEGKRYGVDIYASIDDRHILILKGLRESWRVVKLGGTVLVKCQDMVAGGKVRWQTNFIINAAYAMNLELVDRFDRLGSRAQPTDDDEERVQQHARRNSSTLLVFKKRRNKYASRPGDES